MRVILVFGFLFVAACGGSSGGGGILADRNTQAEMLEDVVLGDEVSNPDKLPDDGTANYTGFMTAHLPTGDDGARSGYIGDLQMAVDFSAERNQVSGRARNFANNDGLALDGKLRLRGGDLFRDTDPDDNYTFTGNVDGRLSADGDTYDIDARIEGEFRGRRQNGVSGLLFGDVTGPFGQDIFDGDFVAVKD